MTEKLIEKVQRETGGIPVESEAEGMIYLAHPEDSRIAILTDNGRIILTEAQTRAVAGEILDVYDLYARKDPC